MPIDRIRRYFSAESKARRAEIAQAAADLKTLKAELARIEQNKEAIKRAVLFINDKEGKLRFLNRTPIEKLIAFLKINKFDDVAKDLAAHYDIIKTSPTLTQDFTKYIRTKVAPVVHALPIPTRTEAEGEEGDKSYKKRLAKFYKDLGFAGQVGKMREFKHLFSQVYDQFKLPKPEYTLLGDSRRDEKGVRRVNFADSKKLNQQLAEYAFNKKPEVTASSEITYDAVYTYDPNKTVPQQKIAEKASTRNWKNVAFISTIIIALLIGVAESAAPYSIYTSLLPSVVISFIPFVAPFVLPATVILLVGFIAGAAGLIVNAMLFQGDSFSTVKDLFFKNRFLRNADGSKASKAKIFVNGLALFLAAFAAVTISLLSWYFSFLSPVLALGVLVVSILGWQGVLSNGLMQTFNMDNVKKFGKFLKGLLWKPLKALWSELKQPNTVQKFKNLARYTLLFVINAAAVVAMFGGSAVVVVSTFLFFSSKFVLIPALVGVLGPIGVMGLVAGAEIALGTFFTMNVFRLVGAMRDATVSFFGLEIQKPKSQDMHNLDKALGKQSTEAKLESSFRIKAIRVGKVLAGLGIVAAVINAGGFALGYFNFLGILAAAGYFASSLGGNAFAVARAVLVPNAMKVFPKDDVLRDLAAAKLPKENVANDFFEATSTPVVTPRGKVRALFDDPTETQSTLADERSPGVSVSCGRGFGASTSAFTPLRSSATLRQRGKAQVVEPVSGRQVFPGHELFGSKQVVSTWYPSPALATDLNEVEPAVQTWQPKAQYGK